MRLSFHLLLAALGFLGAIPLACGRYTGACSATQVPMRKGNEQMLEWHIRIPHGRHYNADNREPGSGFWDNFKGATRRGGLWDKTAIYDTTGVMHMDFHTHVDLDPKKISSAISKASRGDYSVRCKYGDGTTLAQEWYSSWVDG